MSTLLLRLAGPMQAWGTQDRFGHRFTELEPSKSGVLGLVCAALGRPRTEPVDDLAALRMGVRVDREGVMSRDFHTAGGGDRPNARPGEDKGYGVVKATGKSGDTAVSIRHYLADADFLVGLEGDEALLQKLEAALRAPHWAIALGRKAFVPSLPVWLPGGGLRSGNLLEALRGEAWQPGAGARQAITQLRAVLEAAPGTGEAVRMDQPVGAAYQDRSFAPREIVTQFWVLGTDVPLRQEDAHASVSS